MTAASDAIRAHPARNGAEPDPNDVPHSRVGELVNVDVTPDSLDQTSDELQSPQPYGVPGAGDVRSTGVLVTVATLLAWWLITEFGGVKPLFLPSPLDVASRFWSILIDGFAGSTLLEHTAISMARVFGAFLVATVIAIPLGILMGVNARIRGITDPFIEFYRPLPPLAYLPLIIIWLGIDETSKVVLIFLAMFAPIVISARAGVRSARVEQIHAAYSMGASKRQVIWNVILPAALPEILTGLRIAIGFGWTTLVAAEMVAAQSGLGFMVLNASEFLNTDIVIMGIIVIGVIALAFDFLMRFIERRLVPWKGAE